MPCWCRQAPHQHQLHSSLPVVLPASVYCTSIRYYAVAEHMKASWYVPGSCVAELCYTGPQGVGTTSTAPVHGGAARSGPQDIPPKHTPAARAKAKPRLWTTSKSPSQKR